MCNLFDNRVSFTDLARVFSKSGLPVLDPPPERAPNLEPLAAIRPTDAAPVIRRWERGVALSAMRWGLIADKPKAAPIINFRGEGRRIGAASRCLVPVTGFCEFTGKAYPKTRWRFTLRDEPWFCLAGLWRRQDTPTGPADRFTLLTMAAGPDMAPYHDRQVVALGPEGWRGWLAADNDERLLAPPVAGVLEVSRDGPAPAAEAQLPLAGL